MKLNWFSPVPPSRSAIAIDTANLVPAIAQHAEVVLWVSEASCDRALEKHATIRHYEPDSPPWGEINSADVSIFHLGNHPDFHAPIWRINRRHPGIVVLHDLNVQELFAAMVSRQLGLTFPEYFEMMAFHHPENGALLADAFLHGRQTPGEIAADCPLTGAALENATGVMVHTPFGREMVRSLTTLPVAYVPLPVQPGPAAVQRKAPDDQPYQIIVFGFLGPNRRLETALEALRRFPQRERYRLNIFGTLENEEEMRHLIEQSGLAHIVTLRGFVSDEALSLALDHADLAINLRNPTMGESSSSQLRLWQHGLPSLVSRLGWYATLPANTVALVRTEAELDDIAAHLANFLQDPGTYRKMGENGRRYVEEHHSVEAYLRGLFTLIEEAARAVPVQATAWVAGRAGRELRPWFVEEAAGILLPRLAQAIHDAFGSAAPAATGKRRTY